ncbi:hypothetical protein [Dongia deserti]|uniref:hypothetical protein n=1 Tax=Dongia deserti TaxID=2268030 RepID=UPI000E64A96E|nr:hypothetical protein [Dongia deserti]
MPRQWLLAHIYMVGLYGQPRDLEKAAYYNVLSLGPRYGHIAAVLAHRMQTRNGITAPILARALLKVAAESRGRSRR